MTVEQAEFVLSMRRVAERLRSEAVNLERQAADKRQDAQTATEAALKMEAFFRQGEAAD